MTDVVTTIIAVYGAILSTIAIFWNIFRDKKRLKVGAVLGFYTYSNKVSETLITFEAVNIGKVPINLVSCGIAMNNNKNLQLLYGVSLPCMLNESQNWNHVIPLEKFKESIEGHKPKYLWFKDNTGKTYKSNKDLLKKLLGSMK